MKIIKMLSDDGNAYGSYKVWDQLVELSGLPTIEQSEIDLQCPETLFCPILNGNSLAWARSERKCKLYVLQIERWLGTADEFAPDGFDRMLIADRWQANKLAETKSFVRYMPIGGHEGLGGEKVESLYDLAVCAYIYGRRQAFLNQIASQGWRVAPSALYPERDAILSRCRAGLSLHQANNDHSLNPLRSVLFSAWKLPLVFEHVKDPFPFSAYGLDQIAEAIEDSRGYAKTNYDLMTGPMNFRDQIELACE